MVGVVDIVKRVRAFGSAECQAPIAWSAAAVPAAASGCSCCTSTRLCLNRYLRVDDARLLSGVIAGAGRLQAHLVTRFAETWRARHSLLRELLLMRALASSDFHHIVKRVGTFCGLKSQPFSARRGGGRCGRCSGSERLVRTWPKRRYVEAIGAWSGRLASLLVTCGAKALRLGGCSRLYRSSQFFEVAFGGVERISAFGLYKRQSRCCGAGRWDGGAALSAPCGARTGRTGTCATSCYGWGILTRARRSKPLHHMHE